MGPSGEGREHTPRVTNHAPSIRGEAIEQARAPRSPQVILAAQEFIKGYANWVERAGVSSYADLFSDMIYDISNAKLQVCTANFA